MRYQWGDVDGDINADAIIRNSREDWRVYRYVGIAVWLLLIAVAVWFSLTGADMALAILMVASVFAIGVEIQSAAHSNYTMTMITERRTQLIEQKLAEIEMRLAKPR